MIGSDLGIWLELGNFLSPNHKTSYLRAVAHSASCLSISILSFLSKRTPLLAEHIATLNEDYISQLPVPPAVAMWPSSGQWHTRESVIWNFTETMPEKGGGHILCLSISPPSSRLALQEHPWTRRRPYSKMMELTERACAPRDNGVATPVLDFPLPDSLSWEETC